MTQGRREGDFGQRKRNTFVLATASMMVLLPWCDNMRAESIVVGGVGTLASGTGVPLLASPPRECCVAGANVVRRIDPHESGRPLPQRADVDAPRVRSALRDEPVPPRSVARAITERGEKYLK